MNFKTFSLITMCSFSSYAAAGTAEKVNSWFNNMDYANVTAPGVYEGQTARYATLGGISTRAPITQPFNFVNIQTPKFSAGCGGIDFYAGGFSAINADEFIKNLRAIGQNAQSLAFMLGIQIVSPQLSGVMEDINSWAQKFNALNMDSCEAATQLVGGTLDFFGAKEGNCTIKRMQDFGEDWSTANHNCTPGGGRVNETESSGDSPNEVAFIKGNLAWSVLMQDPLFKSDLDFAELIMNLTGTIIISDISSSDDSGSNIQFVDPAVDENGIFTEQGQNIYTALLLGRKAREGVQIRKCIKDRNSDPDGCSAIANRLQKVTANWQGLKTRVEDEVSEILEKIYDDRRLSNVQLGLIRSTKIPLYRYLTAAAAYFPRGSNVASVATDYSDLIAEDILLRNLSAVLEKTRQSISSLPNNMGDSERGKEFWQRMSNILKGIGKLREKNRQDAELYFSMQGRIQNYERAVMSRLSSGMIQSTMWGQ